MLIGYMRVSTGEQSLDLQSDALERAGCERVYEDVCSGRATERPGLAQALEVARNGDALAVWKLDRIGRKLPHVVGLVGDLQKRGVGLKVLTGDVDTTTATGRLVFGIFATLAEFERDLIHERTMAGLAAARARGRTGGRPRGMTKQKLKAAMAMMADRENVARDAAKQLGISLSTLYAYVNAKGRDYPQFRDRHADLQILDKYVFITPEARARRHGHLEFHLRRHRQSVAQGATAAPATLLAHRLRCRLLHPRRLHLELWPRRQSLQQRNIILQRGNLGILQRKHRCVLTGGVMKRRHLCDQRRYHMPQIRQRQFINRV